MATTQTQFNFTIETNASELTAQLVDALYEAGCDDATVGITGGVVFLDFTRAAVSYDEAVKSALADVHRASTGLKAKIATGER